MSNVTGTSVSTASMGNLTPAIMSSIASSLGSLMSYKQELLGDNNWVAWKLRMTNVFSLHKVIDHIISHIPSQILLMWQHLPSGLTRTKRPKCCCS